MSRLSWCAGKHAVARQLQLVSFVEGLIDFTARFGEKDNEIVQIVNLKVRQAILKRQNDYGGGSH